MLAMGAFRASNALVKVPSRRVLDTNVRVALNDALSVHGIASRKVADRLLVVSPTTLGPSSFRGIQLLATQYHEVYVVPLSSDAKHWTDYVDDMKDAKAWPDRVSVVLPDDPCIDVLEDLSIVRNTDRFHEHLEDLYFRGKDVVVAWDPVVEVHRMPFDTHVVGLVGSQRLPVCQNQRFRSIQVIDWNPRWVFSRQVSPCLQLQ